MVEPSQNPEFTGSAIFDLLVSVFLLFSAFFMAEQRRMLKMTRETQGSRWTKKTRNQKKILRRGY